MDVLSSLGLTWTMKPQEKTNSFWKCSQSNSVQPTQQERQDLEYIKKERKEKNPWILLHSSGEPQRHRNTLNSQISCASSLIITLCNLQGLLHHNSLRQCLALWLTTLFTGMCPTHFQALCSLLLLISVNPRAQRQLYQNENRRCHQKIWKARSSLPDAIKPRFHMLMNIPWCILSPALGKARGKSTSQRWTDLKLESFQNFKGMRILLTKNKNLEVFILS